MKSLTNSFINVVLLKEQLRRFWAIGAAFLVAHVLTVILILINQGITAGTAQAHFMLTILTMSHPILVASMVIAPFCVVMALFPYCFSGTAATTYFTFPITKRQLFFTNIVAGAILLILPVFVLSLMLLVPVTYMSFSSWDSMQFIPAPESLFQYGQIMRNQTVNTFPQVFGFFMRTSVGMMFYFGMFKLAVVVCGSRVISVLLCGAFPFVPVALHGLVRWVANVYIFGFSNVNTEYHVTATVVATNPVTWMGIINRSWGFENITFNSLLPNHIIYISITILLFIIAYICACKRRHERTGDSVVFEGLKKVVVFITAMAGMIVMGLFLMLLTQTRFMMYVGFVIGFILAYLIAQMIAEKSFNIRHKLKALLPYSGIMLGMYITMMLFTRFGMIPYTNRVPAPQNVVGVTIQHGRGAHFIEDAYIITRVIDVHNTILDNQSYLRSVYWRRITNSRSFSQTINISYLLENGNEVHRQYHVSSNFMARSGLNQLMREPSVQLSHYHVLFYPQVINSIRFDFVGRGGVRGIYSVTVQSSDFYALVEAIKQDYVNSVNTARMSQRYHATLNFDINWGSQVVRNRSWRWNTRISFYVAEDGAIMQWLIAHGYL